MKAFLFLALICSLSAASIKILNYNSFQFIHQDSFYSWTGYCFPYNQLNPVPMHVKTNRNIAAYYKIFGGFPSEMEKQDLNYGLNQLNPISATQITDPLDKKKFSYDYKYNLIQGQGGQYMCFYLYSQYQTQIEVRGFELDPVAVRIKEMAEGVYLKWIFDQIIYLLLNNRGNEVLTFLNSNLVHLIEELKKLIFG